MRNTQHSWSLHHLFWRNGKECRPLGHSWHALTLKQLNIAACFSGGTDIMATSQSHAIVEQFYAAQGRQDFRAVRRLLRDDLSFHGPIDQFDNADDYVE